MGNIKEYFLSIYYVPGTLLGAKDMAVNKRDEILVFVEHGMAMAMAVVTLAPLALSPPCVSGSAVSALMHWLTLTL